MIVQRCCVLCTAHSENEVLVPVGESVTFNCSASQPVDWFYQRSESSSMQQVSSAGVMVNGFEADGRYTLTPLGGLMIDNITLDNSGFYSCVVSGQGVLLILHLIVQSTVLLIIRRNRFLQRIMIPPIATHFSVAWSVCRLSCVTFVHPP